MSEKWIYLVWTEDPIIPVDEGSPSVEKDFDSEEKAKEYIKEREKELKTKYDREHTTFWWEAIQVE